MSAVIDTIDGGHVALGEIDGPRLCELDKVAWPCQAILAARRIDSDRARRADTQAHRSLAVEGAR